MESFLLEVVAKVVVLCGTDVDVSHYQGVLPRVYDLQQMLSQLGEGLSRRSVNANDVDFLHVKLDYLQVCLPELGNHASHPFFDEGRKSFTAALTHEMSSISLHLILLLFLITFFQPGFLDKEDVALHQYGIGSDVLHVLAKGAGVEGADLQQWRFLDGFG